MVEKIDMEIKVAVYTGSFDPVTLGHLNVIERGCQLVDQLIIGIGINVEKEELFSPEERLELVQRVTSQWDNVEVRVFRGLAVQFVRECGARLMIRGIRPLTDIAAEFTMMMANRQLDSGVETIFLMADEDFSHISSSLIKQIAVMSDDEMLARFIPAEIIPDIRDKLKSQ
jgi:pantetheine-phosphate adenylyltransferase